MPSCRAWRSRGTCTWSSLREVCPGCRRGYKLVQILKGVPQGLIRLDINVHKVKMRLRQHELDACFFLLYDQNTTLRGTLTTHVDDLLLGCCKDMQKDLREALSGLFPISEWEEETFDYVGFAKIRRLVKSGSRKGAT